MITMKRNELDILILVDNGLSTVGGEQESTKIIIDGIKNKYNLGVIQPGKYEEKDRIVKYFSFTKYTRIKHLIKNPFLFIYYLINIWFVIKDNNPKIIHTQAQASFLIVTLYKKLGLISKNIYCIHTERGLYTKYNIIFKKVFIFFMKELDALVTTTNFNMKYWKEVLDKKKYSINYIVIENTAGKIFEAFDKSKTNRNNNKILIGFAGRYTDWKNWPLAVEIIEKINNKIGQNIEVVMAIGCLDKKSLKKTVLMYEKLKSILNDRFDGKINIKIEEMDDFYYKIDIFILTSKYNTESFGRTLVEAMSRNTIVLSTNAGGPVEVIGNESNIFNNADEFVSSIYMYYKDREKMKYEKENNLNRVRNIYSLSNNVNKHLSMYSKIINLQKDNY